MYDLLQRRLQSEWALLQNLAKRNPGRLINLKVADTTFSGELVRPPARKAGTQCWKKSHAFQLVYPVHFPTVPMELYLQQPVRHPNVHPETGFVCLWDKHRVSYTAEHAMHRLAAMLDGSLFNSAAIHVMQPAAVEEYAALRSASPEWLLQGVEHDDTLLVQHPSEPRRRLS